MSGERDVAYDDTVYGVRRALDILDSPRPMIEVASAVVAGVIAVRDRDQALAQRDAARDIAARLEGELARAAEVCDAAWLWMLDSGCERRAPIMQRLRAIADADPDAVIAEGES